MLNWDKTREWLLEMFCFRPAFMVSNHHNRPQQRTVAQFWTDIFFSPRKRWFVDDTWKSLSRYKELHWARIRLGGGGGIPPPARLWRALSIERTNSRPRMQSTLRFFHHSLQCSTPIILEGDNFWLYARAWLLLWHGANGISLPSSRLLLLVKMTLEVQGRCC